MANYKWKVTGMRKVRGKLEAIKDEVETSKLDSSSAHRKARGKYPKASELSVTRIVNTKED